MNLNVTVAGMALTLLGILIPLIGWVLLLPLGIIFIIIGLVMGEEERVKEEEKAVPATRSRDKVLLEADLVISEMDAISKKIVELSKDAKANLELVDQYAACFKDAESRINVSRSIEGPLIQIIDEVKHPLSISESVVADLERSKTFYGVQTESLETKIAQEKARLEELRAKASKLEGILFQLRSKRDALTSIMNAELGSEEPETIGLYLKTLIKYREKYGEKAEKRLKDELNALFRRGIFFRKDALEMLYRKVS